MLRARAILRADDEMVVSVSEHDSSCCGARTVVLVMRPDQPTEGVTIDKPIDRVTQADLSAALAPLAGPRSRAAAHLTAETSTRFDW